ncbi:MAG: alpha/beta fold hydrolase [Candidatus Colwellbacteria bacterium]|nr:alpha/beta fold hydrolase [Candidatus Colwellbacteria bacterium]
MENSLWTDKKLMKGAEPIFLKGTKKTGVLLFHGWSSSPQEFNPDYVPSTAQYLNDLGYTVYVPRRLGHGTRPEDFDGLHWEDWVEDARKHFNLFAKEVDGIIVGGMSMGAQLALKIAEKESVLGIIAMGTPIFMNLDPLFRVWAWVNQKNRKMIHKRYLHRDKEIAMKKVHYTRYPAYHLYENAKASWEIKKILPTIKVPILVMHSTNDNVIDPMSAKYLFKKIGSKDKDLIWVKDSYHSFTTDRNSGIACQAMGDFVNRISEQ